VRAWRGAVARAALRWAAALLASGLLAATATAQAGEGLVALTFDDLPGLSLVPDQPYVNYINDMLLRGLKHHRMPAIGFVNESKLDLMDRPQQIANLQKWVDAGFDLGNHTFSHDSPEELGGTGYILDIARGETVTRALLAARHRRLQWFRHPYLETGFPEAVKLEINRWLDTHGYRVAPVTIDADDWEFAEPYDDALSRHDDARAHRIRLQYLAYTERTVAWYQSASQALFGRQIAFVMLLHATRLNADSLDDLADILRRRKLKVVSLDRAMKDPAYRLGDPYVGHDGVAWLERWAEARHKDLPWDSWQDPPRDIVDDYDRTNNDRRDTPPRLAPLGH